MAKKLVKNIRAGQYKKAPVAPLKDDGSSYSFVYYSSDYSYAVFTDTYAEIISELISNYLDMNDEQQLNARDNYLHNIMKLLRLNILSNLSEESLNEIEEWELKELQYHDDLNHIAGGWNRDSFIDSWKLSIPLVLLEKDYKPFTDKERIYSEIDIDAENPKNIIWLKNKNEQEFIISLIKTKQIIVGRV